MGLGLALRYSVTKRVSILVHGADVDESVRDVEVEVPKGREGVFQYRHMAPNTNLRSPPEWDGQDPRNVLRQHRRVRQHELVALKRNATCVSRGND